MNASRHIHTLSLSFSHTHTHIHTHTHTHTHTRIHSIARDLGRELASAAHMHRLVRTKQGEFVLADCLEMSAIGDADAIVKRLRLLPGTAT